MQRPELRSLSDVQRAHSLRPAKLVRGNREQVHAEFFHVDGNFSGSLHGIGMKYDSLLGGNLADFLDGLNRSSLVVCEHERDQDGLRANRARGHLPDSRGLRGPPEEW